MGEPIVYLSRRIVFSASHRLHSEEMSELENQEFFGKCNNPNGHGHNYELTVTLRGPVHPKTGVLVNLTELKSILCECIEKKMDHRNLNSDVPEFRNLNPTAENIAVVCWNAVKGALSPEISPYLYEVDLKETENNRVVYRGE